MPFLVAIDIKVVIFWRGLNDDSLIEKSLQHAALNRALGVEIDRAFASDGVIVQKVR